MTNRSGACIVLFMSTNATTCETPRCSEVASVVVNGWLHLCRSCAIDELAASERLDAYLASDECVAEREHEAAELAMLESTATR